MIAYVDSSVVLRFALGQPGTLSDWNKIEEAVTSALTGVECLRTLDRVRLLERLPRRAGLWHLLRQQSRKLLSSDLQRLQPGKGLAY